MFTERDLGSLWPCLAGPSHCKLGRGATWVHVVDLFGWLWVDGLSWVALAQPLSFISPNQSRTQIGHTDLSKSQSLSYEDPRPNPGLRGSSPGPAGSARINTCSLRPLDGQAFPDTPRTSTHISQHCLRQHLPISDISTGFAIISWCQTGPVNDLNSMWHNGLWGSGMVCLNPLTCQR